MKSEKLNCLCRNETRLWGIVDVSSRPFFHIVHTILGNYYAVQNSHFYNSVICKVNASVFQYVADPEFSTSQLVSKHVPKKGSHEQRLSMSRFKFSCLPSPLKVSRHMRHSSVLIIIIASPKLKSNQILNRPYWSKHSNKRNIIHNYLLSLFRDVEIKCNVIGPASGGSRVRPQFLLGTTAHLSGSDGWEWNKIL
jgi:hypothetical protein